MARVFTFRGWSGPDDIRSGSLEWASILNEWADLFSDAGYSGALNAATGTFTGALSAATGTFSGELVAATGTFAGSLSAATGTFAGSLSAATGTFAGSLSAATGTFAGSLSAATGTISQSLSFLNASAVVAAVLDVATGGGNDTLTITTDFLTFVGTSINATTFVGELTGNASSASAVAASALTGTTLASGVTQSSLTNIGALPTSSAGLSSGDLWSNAGVVNIV